jgi:uncharacterized repeat protein (TIGR01451 family)
MRKITYITLLVMVAWVVLYVSGCGCYKIQPSKEPAPVPVKQAAPMDSSTVVYPCDGCGVLKVQKTMPAEVQLNKEFDYYITVTNLTGKYLSQIEITDYLADNFKFVSADPQAKLDGKMLEWVMPKLNPNESQKIKVTGMATSAEAIKQCAIAKYKMPACATTKVVESKLALTKTASPQVLACDNIEIKYTVTNNGSGPTTNVVITETLPDGLMANGAKTVKVPVGTLTPGQSKTFAVIAKADKTGKFSGKAMAQADGDLKSESAVTETIVTKPVLVIEKLGKEAQYFGRDITYDITVSNTGDAVARNTVIEDMIPAGEKFISASMSGAAQAGKVVWNLGDMQPGAKKAVSVTYTGVKIGEVSSKATAMADCATAVSAAAMTNVKGIPAILLEVIDEVDPVEVEQQTKYRIVVTNQGSAPSTNIAITATLEDSMQYIASAGPTTATVAGADVKFAPLASLAAGGKATWVVTVKAVKEGDVRFKAVMASDNRERPVTETESTYFYK